MNPDMGSTDIPISKEPPLNNGLRNHLIRGASGSLLIQVGFAGLAFLNSLVLARVLGAGAYGAFANAMAWVSLFLIPASFGFGTLLVKEVAVYRLRKEWGRLRGLLRYADSLVLALSLFFAAVLGAVTILLFPGPGKEIMRQTLWVAALLLPFFALSKLRESTIRGLEHVIRALLPGMIFRPGLLLFGVLGIYLIWPDRLSAPAAMGVNVLAAALSLAACAFWQRSLLPLEVKQARPKNETAIWIKAAVPMLIYGNAQIMLGQTDIVMLGALREARDVGVYAVATRLAYLLLYASMAAEIILAPVMARLYVNNDKEKLQRIITRVVRAAFFIVLPLGFTLVFLGHWILALFGLGFATANYALTILVIGRLVEVAAGSGALLLAMTGHERILAVVFLFSGLANVVLNALMIPIFGIEGAALASAICLVVVKIVLSVYAKNRTGLHMTVLGGSLSHLPIMLRPGGR